LGTDPPLGPHWYGILKSGEEVLIMNEYDKYIIPEKYKAVATPGVSFDCSPRL
jgi:hypothetical protein